MNPCQFGMLVLQFPPVASPTRVVLAPDKFKGTLSAARVCAALASGIATEAPDVDIISVPAADGGDGSVDAALLSGFDTLEIDTVGPTGVARRAPIATRGTAAVIELATICGLRRLPGGVLAPEESTTFGLGVAIRAALDAGATELTVGVGGSASTDGGAGMLVALGARILDEHGWPVPPTPMAVLSAAHRLDLDDLDPRLQAAAIEFAVDVDAPLLGPRGAAHTFGAQKGAESRGIDQLERAMKHWAHVLTAAAPMVDPHLPGSGAAGGTGLAAQAIGARLVDGASAFLELIGFDDAVDGTSLVITGEGRLDAQTLMGKAPAAVAARCAARGIKCIAVVGSRDPCLSESTLNAAGFSAIYEVVAHVPCAAASSTLTVGALERIGAAVASEQLRAPKKNEGQGEPR